MTRTTHNPEETRALAAEWAPMLGRQAVLALHGDLGAGKTCFVQGLAVALGFMGDVTSPTYTLIHEYPGELPLFHIDLYRLRGPGDALSMGLDDYLPPPQGITALEWPERAGDLLPSKCFHLFIEPGDAPSHRIFRLVVPS